MGGQQSRLGLNLKVAQKQILTPGLVQMVSVLALNRIELREMISQEVTANPVLEELPDDAPTAEEISQKTESISPTAAVDGSPLRRQPRFVSRN